MIHLFTLLLVLAPVDDLRIDAEYLAHDGRNGRATGSVGMAEAKLYVARALGREGISVHLQPMGNCHNIIGFIEGSKPSTYIVVGAHLDHLGRVKNIIKNGADDNASGSVVLLQIAKRLSRVKTRRSVVLVWFTGEELGLLGSKEFVRHPFDGDFDPGNQQPVFMLNLDMVGHLKDDLPGSRGKPGELARLFKKYDFAKRITYRNSWLGSDQIPFNKKKVPTVFLHTGDHDLYHTGWDDADTLDYVGLGQICDYAFDIVIQVVGADPERVIAH